MSVRAVAWVLHESPATGNDRLVLIAIADEADDRGRNAFPSQDLIGHKARVPRRTVQRALERLEGAGELLVRRPERQGRGQHNRYVLVMGRDPVALAGEVGWPAPELRPEVLAEWASQCPPSPGVDNVGDNVLDVEQKGAEGRHSGPERASPSGARPVYPLTQEARGAETGGQPARRRGLDPSPPTAGDVAGEAQRRRLDLEDQRRANPCGACHGDRLVEQNDGSYRACSGCGGRGVAA